MAKARRKSTTRRPHRGTARSATGTITITGGFTAHLQQRRPYTYTVWKLIGEGPGRTGRPSAKNLVREKAEKQIASDIARGIHKTLKVYGNELSKWVRTTHPQLPPMSPDRVARNISDIWNARRKSV
jgi:hypothetical protein